MAVRCLIVDDNASFIEAATALLRREGIEVIASSSTSQGLLALAREHTADLLLIDVDLGGENGFDCARLIADELGADAPPMVLISTYPAADFADLVASSPAAGFVPKSALSRRAIDELLNGNPGT